MFRDKIDEVYTLERIRRDWDTVFIVIRVKYLYLLTPYLFIGQTVSVFLWLVTEKSPIKTHLFKVSVLIIRNI